MFICRSCLSLSIASTLSSQMSDRDISQLNKSLDQSPWGTGMSPPKNRKQHPIVAEEFSDFCEILQTAPSKKYSSKSTVEVPRRRSQRLAGGGNTVVNGANSNSGGKSSREGTPSRILGNQLSGLSLGGSPRKENNNANRRGTNFLKLEYTITTGF